MTRFLLSIFILITISVLIHANGYYTIICPGTIHPNSDFSVEVTLQHAKSPCIIELQISGPNFKKKSLLQVNPWSTELVKFKIPNIIEGTYTLNAEGLAGLIFKKSTELNFADNNPNVHIQTDKATYKPEDLVQFRVILLNENMRPALLDQTIAITITDSEKNLIKKYSAIKPKNGVFKGQLQITDSPNLGDWLIEVQINGKPVMQKLFTIEKYVLPKFYVTIDAPKKVCSTDDHLSFTLKSKYTFGKQVEGKAFITIKSIKLSSDGLSKEPITIVKTVDFKGKHFEEFKMKQVVPDGRIVRPSQEIQISVVVADNIGNKRNASAEVQVVEQAFLINAPSKTYVYKKKNESFKYSITITSLDNTGVSDTKHPVIMTGNNTIHKSFATNGIATYDLQCNNEVSIRFNIEYRGATKETTIACKYNFFVKEKIGLIVKTERPRLGQPIEILLHNYQSIKYFVYTVVARGNIVLSKFVTIWGDDVSQNTFYINPTFEMIPQVKVYVHFMDSEGYYDFYEETICLEKQFENSITIEAPDQVEPGADVQLQINTDIDSYIGLLAVDQSVLLLKSGNDLIYDDFFKALENFTTETPKKLLTQENISKYPGGPSGVITITNAYIPDETVDIDVKIDDGAVIPVAHNPLPNSPVDGQQNKNQIHVRTRFLETWLFQDFSSENPNGIVKFNSTIPDTITSWVITGFSVNQNTGFALTKMPTKVQTFRPFFATLHLPYSIKRGEIISLPVIVFNYLTKSQNVKITFENNDNEFDFIDAAQNTRAQVKSVNINADSSEVVYFRIKSNQIGYITLKVIVTTPEAGDAVQKLLKVIPEGMPIYKNSEIYLNADENHTIKLDIPNDFSEDSLNIEASVSGYVLGNVVSNINNPDALIRAPSGCGEQNMMKFVPNILVLRFFKVGCPRLRESGDQTIGENNSELFEKAKSFLEKGYQRELIYKHNDGSFSAFGKGDSSGSTWLTAYVIRSFILASNYIHIDMNVLNEGLKYLKDRQLPNGAFEERGKVIDFTRNNEMGITAFTLLTLMEDSKVAKEYESVIDRGLQYLKTNVKNTDDIYSLSVALYVLQLTKSDEVSEILPKILAKANTSGNLKWWSKATSGNRWSFPKSHDVEVTGYIMLTLLERRESVTPIMNWLLSRRNKNGGFDSTQETVVGLQALTKFAEKQTALHSNLIIEMSSEGKSIGNFNVNKNNSLTVQKLEIDKDVREIALNTRGFGSATLQISYDYVKILKDETKPSFQIDLKINSNEELLQLNLEIKYISLDSSNSDSNMVVMEVSLPSGYIGTENPVKYPKDGNIKRVELKKDNTKIIVYFNSLKPNEVEFIPVEAERTHVVTNQKLTPILIYDYYDPQRSAYKLYKL